MRDLKDLPGFDDDDGLETLATKQRPHPMKWLGEKLKGISKGAKWFLIGMIAGAIVTVGVFMVVPAQEIIKLRNDLAERVDTPYDENIDVSAMLGDFREVCNLSTVDYRYTGVGTGKKDGFRVLFFPEINASTLLVTFDGEITAGIDLSEITEDDIKQEGKTVTVYLPHAVVFTNSIDPSSEKAYIDKEGIFNDMTEEDRARYRAQWEEQMQESAINNGLLTMAENNAKTAIEDLGPSILPEGFTIEVVLPEDE